MKKFIFILLFCANWMLYAQSPAYQKLAGELKKYAVVYDQYSGKNFPVLSGNTEIGGLTDPLGRGVYNIEINDLFLNKRERVTGPGMILKIAAFSGLAPQEYRQAYDLENGVLTTQAAYARGSYESTLFFSQDDRELFVYTFTNTGNTSLICNMDLGQYNLNLVNRTNTTIYAVSNPTDFTPLQYFLKTNIPFDGYFYGTIAPYLTVRPKQTLQIVLRLRTNAENVIQENEMPADTKQLLDRHTEKWKKNWQSMGIIILPDGDYAKTFYRSLHWLQCTAGGANNNPGESHFATLTSRIAAEYQYTGEVVFHRSWDQNPFTYGGAGWSAFAYTLFGNEEKAKNILSNMYRPDALKKNVTLMFPVGDKNFEYNNQAKGMYNYLSYDNPDAICFAHEQLYDRTSRQDFPVYEIQIHIQGFAPAMFYQYGKMYNAMEDTVYQVLRGSAEFWSTILNYDKARKMYSLPPVLSLSENLFEADVLDGLLAAKWTLTQAATMAKKRNVDATLQKKWLDIARNIKFFEKNDMFLEFKDDDGTRAGADYWGIRGYAYLGFPTMELMSDFSTKKVHKSLDQSWIRNKRGIGMITFLANWFALTDAYWGRAEEAYEKSLYCLTQIDESGTAMCEQNKVMYYFLTSYSSFTLVPLSMVLQTVGNEIRVFPAVPKAFSDIEFYNLPAANGIRVSGTMKNGKTQSVKFEKDGKILKEIKNKDKVVVLWKDNKLIEN